MHLSFFAFVTFSLLIFFNNLQARDNPEYSDAICATVLKEKAFNTSEFSQVISINLKTRDEYCDKDYLSQGEASSAGNSASASLGYDLIEFGTSEVKTTSNNKFSIKDSRVCKAKADDIQALTTNNAKSSMTDKANETFLKCIQIKASENAKYVLYTVSENTESLDGDIHTRVAQHGKLTDTLQGIQVEPAIEKDIKCAIDLKNYPVNKVINIKIEKTPFNFKCSKPASTEGTLTLKMEQGDSVSIPLNSPKAKEQNKLDQLEAQNNELRNKLTKLTEEFEKSSKDVNASIVHVQEFSASSLALAKTDVAAKLAAIDSRVNPIEGLAKIKWKGGNNGHASCEDFCKGSQWPDFVGNCLLGVAGGEKNQLLYQKTCKYILPLRTIGHK